MHQQDYQMLIARVREMQRQQSYGDRVGRVHEVKHGDNGEMAVRVVIGGTKEKPCLTPWIRTTDHRGGSTERDFYKKGQNVRVSAVGGDFRQATISPWAESQKFGAPKHARGKGLEDSKTGQLGASRRTTTKDTVEHWIADKDDEEQEDQSNGVAYSGGGSGGMFGSGGGSGQAGGQSQQGQQGQGQQGQQEDGKPAYISRINKEGGITQKGGEDSRVAVHKDGAKMRKKDTWVVVDKEGNVLVATKNKPYVDKPWEIKKKPDPIANDDKYEHAESGGGGQAGGGGGSGSGSGGSA